MRTLSEAFNSIQKWLLPELEEELGDLTDKQKEFVETVELLELEKFMEPYYWQGVGRKPADRLSILKSFNAKSVYNYPTAKLMRETLLSNSTLRRLCGWERKAEIPSESTFSRAFASFSAAGLPREIHESTIKKHIGEQKLVGHVSRDSTSIVAREKSKKKPKLSAKEKKAKKKPKKRGRPAKNEVRPPAEPKRLELQIHRSLEENLVNLPKECDFGTKKDSKGKKHTWKGYKLHVDTIDGDIPVSAILTSASPHDSQAAIPLAQMTAERLTNCYDLMDSAYDAPQIHDFSRNLGHVPVIDHYKRKGEKIEFDPAKAVRYHERSAAERANANLKDNHGGDKVRVKGHDKVFAHLMIGILVITAKQLFNLLC